jgi:hypothetical protein
VSVIPMPARQKPQVSVTCDENHVYWTENGIRVLGLTEVIRLGILREDPVEQQKFQSGPAQPYLARGRRVHAATHYADEGDLARESVHPQEMGYLESWEKLRTQFEFEIVLAEKILYDHLFGFACRPDRIAFRKVRGHKQWLVPDLKTGSVPWWGKYQTAAQWHAWLTQADAPEELVGGRGNFAERMCVQLDKDGACGKLVPYPMAEYTRDLGEFCAALQLVRLWKARRIV